MDKVIESTPSFQRFQPMKRLAVLQFPLSQEPSVSRCQYQSATLLESVKWDADKTHNGEAFQPLHLQVTFQNQTFNVPLIDCEE